MVALLPADASARVEKAAADDAAAATRIATLTEQIDNVRQERAALTHDETLLQREPDNEHSTNSASRSVRVKPILPKRHAELGSAEMTLKRASSPA
jgi:anti-sigma factor RsiW